MAVSRSPTAKAIESFTDGLRAYLERPEVQAGLQNLNAYFGRPEVRDLLDGLAVAAREEATMGTTVTIPYGARSSGWSGWP